MTIFSLSLHAEARRDPLGETSSCWPASRRERLGRGDGPATTLASRGWARRVVKTYDQGGA